MKTHLLMDFSVDKENNTINVKREFAKPVANVWAAWTQKHLLDQWWAPKPWKARTKILDFREGGYWLYAMIGPEGDEQWCRADYTSITTMKNFKVTDAFCDANGNVNKDFPQARWNIDFKGSDNSTVVSIAISYNKPEDLEKYIEMGFKEGFTAALENLDELLA